MKTILITGGTGLVGSNIIPKLKAKGYNLKLLSRSGGEYKGIKKYKWDIKNQEIDPEAIKGVDVVIHLAGAGIADKRWSEERKKVIVNSRVESTKLLYKAFESNGRFPDTFISASGINYYGSEISEHVFTETDPPRDEFISYCCVVWEEAAEKFTPHSRVVKLRTGIALAKEGGIVAKLITPVKLGFAAALGSGKQYMPYIHIDDLCEMYIFALENEGLSGSFNASNGDHVTNKELTRKMAEALNKPFWLPNIPSFAIKMVLGEMARILIGGSRASAEKIKNAGFSFKYKTLDEALKELFS